MRIDSNPVKAQDSVVIVVVVVSVGKYSFFFFGEKILTRRRVIDFRYCLVFNHRVRR